MMFYLAIRNLARNPRRTWAILLTVAAGSASIVLFKGFNYGILSEYKHGTIHSRFGHGQINTAGYRDMVLEKPWEKWIENYPTVAQKLKEDPRVKHVFPRVEFFSMLTNGRITVSGIGQGVDGVEESKFFTTLNVEQGETLTEQEDGILLGLGLARALNVKPGDRVTVLVNTIHGSMNAGDFTVSGIFHTGSKHFDDRVFRIQLPQAHTLLDTDRVESIALGLTSDQDWPHIEKLVGSIAGLEKNGLEATSFDILDKVYYKNSVDWLEQQFAIIQLIILSIVILGIFNTVSSAVLERRPEIGNLRANGESPGAVIRLLTIEGFTAGILGAFLGIVIAVVLRETVFRSGLIMPPAPGLTRQFLIQIQLIPTVAIMAFGMNAFTTVVGTWLAARRVAKMPIADALRST